MKRKLAQGGGKTGPPGPPAKPVKGKVPPGPPPAKPKPVNKPSPAAPQKPEKPEFPKKTASLPRNTNTSDGLPSRSNSTSFPKKPNPPKLTQHQETPKVEPEATTKAPREG